MLCFTFPGHHGRKWNRERGGNRWGKKTEVKRRGKFKGAKSAWSVDESNAAFKVPDLQTHPKISVTVRLLPITAASMFAGDEISDG